MVAKIVKRTTPKSIKRHNRRHQHHRRTSSPKKTASVSVIASINKSFATCRRRLVKLFSKLARLATPDRRHKGFKILREEQESESEPDSRSGLKLEFESNVIVPRALVFDQCLLPPLVSERKRTVILDLDETLIHSSPAPPPRMYDFMVRPNIEGQIMSFYVLKRPGVDKFLEEISKRYEVVVFTAGLKEYATLVLDKLDPQGFISHRLYRDSCKEVEGKFVKDLSEIGRDLGKLVIVDDNPNAYSLQPANAIPIAPFVDNTGDRELEQLMGFFEGCDSFEDMRDAVRHYIGGGDGGGGGGGGDFDCDVSRAEAIVRLLDL